MIPWAWEGLAQKKMAANKMITRELRADFIFVLAHLVKFNRINRHRVLINPSY
jgi:hypothetical protein